MSGNVSVIMPAHDAGAWIDEALASVLAQGACVREVLVVNDGSGDDTVARVRQWQAREARVRLLDTGGQRGPAAARNLALAEAQGDWIALVDADDILMPGRLDVLLRNVTPDDDVLADDPAWFHDDARRPYRTLWRGASLPATGRRLDIGEFLAASPPERADGLGLLKPLCRRAFLQRHALRFRETLRNGEDAIFYLECLLAGARWRQLPGDGYRYRVRAGSTMTRWRDPSILDAQAAALSALAEQAAASAQPEVARLLRQRAEVIRKALRPLLVLRNRWRAGERGAALLALLASPGLWPALWRRLRVLLSRR